MDRSIDTYIHTFIFYSDYEDLVLVLNGDSIYISYLKDEHFEATHVHDSLLRYGL